MWGVRGSWVLGAGRRQPEGAMYGGASMWLLVARCVRSAVCAGGERHFAWSSPTHYPPRPPTTTAHPAHSPSFQVDTYSGSTGYIRLVVTIGPGPLNDRLAFRTQLLGSLPQVVTGTNVDAGLETGEVPATAGALHSVW